MNFEPFKGQAGQSLPQAQAFWSDQWGRSLQVLQQLSQAGAPQAPADAAAEAPAALEFDAAKLQQLQARYMEQLQALNRPGGVAQLLAGDRRFKAEAWDHNPMAATAAAGYLLASEALLGMAEAVQGAEKARNRVRFAVEQWVAAMSPSNFLGLNAEAQSMALKTHGESLGQGIANLLADMRQGHVSMTDESVFTVGKNVATSEGAVVFENALFQLIEYKPLTQQVHDKPFLMVPPCINKFYILDLQPENSLIRYAVSQGHRTFVVSWRNPDESLAATGWDDYIEQGVIKAISVVQDIAQVPQINALGFCVGGTMLSTALAVLAARHQRQQPAAKRGRRSAAPAPLPVASATLLTTLIDFSDTGVLDVFIDEQAVRFREMQMGAGGLMKGQDLASTFSFLRPNDLVWNYVVGNYLKGETPPAFDLLYWNSDSTNLPGPYYAWYLRNMYLENRLVSPGALTVCGESIDLGLVDVPAYIYGSREDHIVPVAATYGSTRVLRGAKRYVMGASGHIAGVINPPAKNKRSHWIRADGQLPDSHAQWLQGATEHAGSWWTDWSQWLAQHAGASIAAPKRYGRKGAYEPSEPAPGSYVMARA